MPENKDNNAADTLPEGALAPKSAKAGKTSDGVPPASAVDAAPTASPAGTKRADKVSRRGQRAGRRRAWPAVLAGTATLALAAAAVGAGTIFPGSDASAVIDPVPHLLPVGEALADCQGPTQLLAGSAAGTDPEFSANSSASSTQLNAVVLSGIAGDLPGSNVQLLDGKSSPLFTVAQAPASPLATPTELTGEPKLRAAVVNGKSVGGPSVLRVQPLGEERSSGAGSVVVEAGDGDLAGLAAASCQTPSNELWLSGASTTVGRTAVLAISNSSQSPATVSLELFGASGPVQAAGGKGLVVAPGTVRSVVLAGLAPDQELLSVHLKSAGGAVSAVIQQSVLRGLTPGGVDYLAPVQTPGSSLSIPGVRVQAPDTATKISSQGGYGDAGPILAVTVPGVSDAVVEVKAFGPDGQLPLPNGGVFTAAAGKVSQLSLSGLPEGTYSLGVKADAVIAASARIVNSTKPGDGVDVASVPSAGRLGDTHLVTLPQGVSSSLAFTATEGGSTLNLVPISAAGVPGEGKDIVLKAGTTKTVDPAALLGSGTAAVIVSVSGAPTFGTQLLTKADTAGIAVLPIAGTSAGSHSVNITTGY